MALGKVPGIYSNWSAAQDQVKGFSGACHQGFETLEESMEFMYAKGGGNHTEDNIMVYGPRGGQYKLKDWINKKLTSETTVKTVDPHVVADNINNGVCTCATMEPAMKTILDLLLAIKADNNVLRNEISKQIQDMDIKIANHTTANNENRKSQQKLMDSLKVKTDEHLVVTRDNHELRLKVNELTSRLDAQQWQRFRHKSSDTTILLGSSIIKDIDETKLQKTEVISKSGGFIKDIASVVSDKASNDPYARAILVVGGNDCDSRTPLNGDDRSASDIIEEYRSLVQQTKLKAKSVTISSICPRDGPAEISQKIDAVNAGLQVMCGEESVNIRR